MTLTGNIFDKIAEYRIVPLVTLDDPNDAVPLARALVKGGIPVAEVTFRTDAGGEAMERMAKEVPEIIVGAGTVHDVDHAIETQKRGGKFVITPGFNPKVVDWCLKHNMPVCPGTVTPADLEQALDFGLRLVKFFPAGVYGGLAAMKALSGPFGGIKFLPTGGVNAQNIGEFIAAPFIHAVGGSWVCPKADIAAGDFEKITALCKQARSAALGFEVAHVGVNCENGDDSLAVCKKLDEAFALGVKEGNSSNFVSSGIEVMKSMYLGKNGHIAIRTNSVPLAIAELEKKGFVCDMETAKYKGERMIAVYLKEAFGGFAVHLLQK